jgi:cytochrome c
VLRLALAVMMVAATCNIAHAEEDTGAKLFKNHCGTCHSLVDDGRNWQGPLLLGLFTRKAGTQSSYTKYSKGLKAASWQWTPEQLDLWLTDPKAQVADTFMTAYKQKDPEKRRIIIEYIKTNCGI